MLLVNIIHYYLLSLFNYESSHVVIYTYRHLYGSTDKHEIFHSRRLQVILYRFKKIHLEKMLLCINIKFNQLLLCFYLN